MLNHQLILTDAQGRLRTTLEKPEPLDFNGGTPVKDGLLSVTLSDGQFFVNGLGYIVDEQSIAYEQAVNPPVSDPANPFMGTRGRLRAVPDPPAFWLYGLPFSLDGQLSIAPPDDGPPPVDTGAYSNAYSNAFDVKD